jgi:crossover junction endodeoxyribonuclease RuvC
VWRVRVLGIDPGLTRCGVGVVDGSEHRPDAVAVERVFARSDSSTIMGTAQASGIALVVAARRGLPIALHTPSEVKAAVSGNGRADKAQVGAMVVRILRLTEPPRPADAADALALAITHVWRGSAASRLEAAVAKAGPRRTSHPVRIR